MIPLNEGGDILKILFAGHNMRGIRCLEALVRHYGSVVAAISHPPSAESKGYYQSIRRMAQGLNVPVFSPENINSSDFQTFIFNDLKPDIMIMAGYSYLIHKSFYSRFPKGCLNLHASPLPHGRGAAPLNWALIRGEKRWGISIIDIDSGIDTGDILAQSFFDISQSDTIKTLTDRVNELYLSLLIETLEKIGRADAVRIIQNPDEGSYFTKRFPKDGLIDWASMTAEDVHNIVRALTKPYPGAFTHFKGQKTIIWETELLRVDYRGIPGRIAAKRKEGVVVIAKDRGILIKAVGVGDQDHMSPGTFFGGVGSDLETLYRPN